MTVNSPVAEVGYTVLYNNGVSTGSNTSFGSKSQTSVTIANVPEGMKISTFLNDPSPVAGADTTLGSYNIYDFVKWSSSDNNFGSKLLDNGVEDAVEISKSTAVNDALYGSLNNSHTIYAIYKR